MKSTQHYAGDHLQRFVLLGSAVSVLNSFEDMTREGKPYTEKDWNPVHSNSTPIPNPKTTLLIPSR